MTFSLHLDWPQGIVLALLLRSVIFAAFNHGKAKNGKYHIGRTLYWVSVWGGLLYWGGFWG